MRYAVEETHFPPMNNSLRPDFRFPPLRLKHITADRWCRENALAEDRLKAAGYEHDKDLDVWTKTGEMDCCVCRGYVLKLTKATQRHLSVIQE